PNTQDPVLSAPEKALQSTTNDLHVACVVGRQKEGKFDAWRGREAVYQGADAKRPGWRQRCWTRHSGHYTDEVQDQEAEPLQGAASQRRLHTDGVRRPHYRAGF